MNLLQQKDCLTAAKQWDFLADQEERMAVWERERKIFVGEGASPHDHRARLYRDTAESLRLEAETGEYHCVCHLVPGPRCPAQNRPKP